MITNYSDVKITTGVLSCIQQHISEDSWDNLCGLSLSYTLIHSKAWWNHGGQLLKLAQNDIQVLVHHPAVQRNLQYGLGQHEPLVWCWFLTVCKKPQTIRWTSCSLQKVLFGNNHNQLD